MKKNIFASLLDQMLVFGFSVVSLGIFELILRLIGFRMVTTSIPVFLVIFIFIVNVLYTPILEGRKYGTTLGKRILKMDNEAIDGEIAKTVTEEEAK